MRVFSVRVLAVLGAAVLLLGACGNDDGDAGDAVSPDVESSDTTADGTTTEEEGGSAFDELVESAQAEGEVVFYSSLAEETLQALADAFEAEYGISVVYQRLAASPAKERLSQETSSGNVQTDVLSATLDPEFLDEMKEGGHLAELTSEELPNIENLGDDYRGDHFAVSHVETWGVVYNTDEVSEDDLPDTYADLVDMSEWSGRVVIPDAKLGGGYFNWYFAILQQLGESDFEAFIEDLLGGLQPQLATESMSGPLNQVASGELLAAIPVQSSLAQKLIASGAPVGYDTTVEPTGAFQLASSILADGPNPNAARLFVNWLLGEEAAEINCGGGDCAVPHLDIPGSIDLPEGLEYVDSVEAKTTGEDYVVPVFEAARN